MRDLVRVARASTTVFQAGQPMPSDARLRAAIEKTAGAAGRIIMVKAQRHAGDDLDHNGSSADWSQHQALGRRDRRNGRPQPLARAAGDRSLLVGDDLACTNPARIRRAIETGACNARLLKVNQVGTLTEAAQALRLARSAAWMVTVSARSGETEDDWAADLAAGWAADQFKNGSITQSERLASYLRRPVGQARGGPSACAGLPGPHRRPGRPPQRMALPHETVSYRLIRPGRRPC